MKIRSIGHTKRGSLVRKKDKSRELESAQSPMFSGRMMYQKAYVPPKDINKYWIVENKAAGGVEYAYAPSKSKAIKLVAERKNMPVVALRAREDNSILAKLVAIR